MNINVYEDYTNKYELLKIIGRGMCTEVYQAENKKTKELRAIKIIKLSEIREELKKDILTDNVDKELLYYINRIKNEVQNMKKCSDNNDNSLKIYECFHTNDEFVIVLELCDSNLTHLLINKKEGFSPKEIFQILIQLNNTFKIMKENKIVHRDLKPDNILLKYENEEKNIFTVKLCDYGISKVGDFTNLKTHIGTE